MKRIKVGLVLIIMGLVISIIFINKPDNTYKTVEEHIQEGNTIAFMRQEKDGTYKKVEDTPYGYDFNSKKSICSNNAEPTWENGKLKINNLTTKNTACYLYFDRSQAILTLESLGLESKGTTGDIIGPACDSDENCGSDTVKRMDQNGVYYAGEDNDGGSYIFRGTVDNNWVKFGQTSDNQDIWWRIIRINGNGSIRLIYSGKGAQPPTNNGENMMENQRYNTDMNDNTYVGYYYGSPNQTTYEAAHTNEHPSNLAIQTEDWFTSSTNLDDQAQLNHIDENVGFCNDRKLSNYNHGFNDYLNKGYGTEPTWYAIIDRTQEPNSNEALISLVPTLKCGETDSNDYDRDYFTWKEKATRGNRKLNQPVGHITADEVIYAGAFSGEENNSLWLKLDTTGYLTMTPEYFHNSGLSYVVRVDETGRFGAIGKSIGIRPVINLKADTNFKASVGESEWGTKENPYIVEVTE